MRKLLLLVAPVLIAGCSASRLTPGHQTERTPTTYTLTQQCVLTVTKDVAALAGGILDGTYAPLLEDYIAQFGLNSPTYQSIRTVFVEDGSAAFRNGVVNEEPQIASDAATACLQAYGQPSGEPPSTSIAPTSTSLPGVVSASPAQAASISLRGDGLEVANFGEAQTAALKSLQAILGAGRTEGPLMGCGTQYRWDNGELLVQFSDGKLSGYFSNLPGLETPQGITVGTPFGQIEGLDGGASSWTTVGTGRYELSDSTGSMELEFPDFATGAVDAIVRGQMACGDF